MFLENPKEFIVHRAEQWRLTPIVYMSRRICHDALNEDMTLTNKGLNKGNQLMFLVDAKI